MLQCALRLSNCLAVCSFTGSLFEWHGGSTLIQGGSRPGDDEVGGSVVATCVAIVSCRLAAVAVAAFD